MDDPPARCTSLSRCILYFLSCVVLLLLYQKFWRFRLREMLHIMERGNPIYAAFPFVAYVLFSCLFNPYAKIDSFSRFIVLLLFESFIFFMYYLLNTHSYAVYGRIQAEEKLRNTEKLFMMQKKYYEEIDRNVRAQRERLHDMRHHLIAVDSLARIGDCVAINQYVEQLIANYGRQIMKRYCENTVANAVIGGYIEIAQEKRHRHILGDGSPTGYWH